MVGDLEAKKEAKFRASQGGFIIGAAILAWCVSPILPLAVPWSLALAGVLISLAMLSKYEKDVNGDTHPVTLFIAKRLFPAAYFLLVIVIVDATISSFEHSFDCRTLQTQMLDRQTGSETADKLKESAHDNFSALGCHYQATYLGRLVGKTGFPYWPALAS